MRKAKYFVFVSIFLMPILSFAGKTDRVHYKVHKEYGAVNSSDPKYRESSDRCLDTSFNKGVNVRGDLIRNRETLILLHLGYLQKKYSMKQISQGDKFPNLFEKDDHPDHQIKIYEKDKDFQHCLREIEGWVSKTALVEKKTGKIKKWLD